MKDLSYFSYIGHFEKVKHLVEQGVNLHFNNEQPLRFADMNYQYNTVKYILSLEPNMYWLTHQDKRIREIYKKYI